MRARVGALAFALAACCFGAWAQEQPLAYVLPVGDRVVVVLGAVPPGTAAMQVLRQGPGDNDLVPLTDRPIRPAEDPAEAAALMGADFDWIARRTGSPDPATVWSRLSGERSLGLALALVSHGLRTALGRTLVDLSVTAGRTYRYRVVLLDSSDKEIARIEKRVTVTQAEPPPPPRDVKADAGDGVVSISWSYASFRGGEGDRTVGFFVYRRDEQGNLERIGDGPFLRLDGMLAAVDRTARNGTRYTYAVQAIDIAGVSSGAVATAAVVPRDRTPPLVPTGLAALDRPQGVLLLWDLSPDVDAAGYNVYRSGAGTSEPVRLNGRPIPEGVTRYVDAAAVRGEPLYYRVSAVDEAGNESAAAGPVTIIARDTEPPPGVENLTVEVEPRTRVATLRWKAVEARDLDGYLVYSGPAGDRLMRITREALVPEREPSFVDGGYRGRGLAPGATVVYGVSAVDRSGNESAAVRVEARVPDNEAPDPPVGFSARSAPDGTVDLLWQPSLAPDQAGYRVYRAEGRDFILVAEVQGTAWTDSRAVSGARYRYRVSAVDRSGNEGDPTTPAEVLATDLVPPDPPSELGAVAERDGVRLSWRPSPASDVEGYVVFAAPYLGAVPRRLTERPVDGPAFLHRQGKAGVSYEVAAVDRSGNMSRRVGAVAAPERQGGPSRAP